MSAGVCERTTRSNPRLSLIIPDAASSAGDQQQQNSSSTPDNLLDDVAKAENMVEESSRRWRWPASSSKRSGLSRCAVAAALVLLSLAIGLVGGYLLHAYHYRDVEPIEHRGAEEQLHWPPRKRNRQLARLAPPQTDMFWFASDQLFPPSSSDPDAVASPGTYDGNI